MPHVRASPHYPSQDALSLNGVAYDGLGRDWTAVHLYNLKVEECWLKRLRSATARCARLQSVDESVYNKPYFQVVLALQTSFDQGFLEIARNQPLP